MLEQSINKQRTTEQSGSDEKHTNYGNKIKGKLPHIYGLFTDTQRELQKTYERYGNTVNTGLGQAHWLFGPEWNEQVYLNSTGEFSSERGWRRFLHGVFPGSVMAMDGMDHKKQRRIMAAAFKKPNLLAYLDNLNPQIQSSINDWAKEDKFLVYPAVKTLTLDIATKVFMGAETGPNADKINIAFVDAVNASIGFIKKPLPFTKQRKGEKGRAFLYQEFLAALPERRRKLTPDFFSQFCHATTDEGESFTDEEIINHMIFLMMAAHDTTTSTISTLFYLLGKHQDWQTKLREEAKSLKKEVIEFDDQDKLEQLDWCIREALRMHPPLPVMPRAATNDFSANGFTIKKDSVVFVAPLHTHYMEEYWSNPEKFDPERFSPERKEHKSHSYAWIPFGGGAHMCVGQHFGFMEIKAIMHQVLLKYEWTIPSNYQMPYQHIPIGKPGGSFRVNLKAC